MTEKLPSPPSSQKRYSPFKRRQRRLLFLGIILPSFVGATALGLIAVSQTQVYAYAPSTLPPYEELNGREVRLGGLVAKGSLIPGEEVAVTFSITDGESDVPVLFNDVLPGLVAENDGVVAQGHLQADGTFLATTILARHDENYMAPEVADALKETGRYEEYIEQRRQ
ncbi:MAG: cytochrome c maturation protein CcmE [Pseudomonadota bacterium]